VSAIGRSLPISIMHRVLVWIALACCLQLHWHAGFDCKLLSEKGSECIRFQVETVVRGSYFLLETGGRMHPFPGRNGGQRELFSIRNRWSNASVSS